jgi:hypothetical protein
MRFVFNYFELQEKPAVLAQILRHTWVCACDVNNTDSATSRVPDHLFYFFNYTGLLYIKVGRDSSVDVAPRYNLEGPGIESQLGEIFRTYQDRPWGPTSIL